MASAEPICHVVTPVSNLGYGYDNNELHALLQRLAADPTPTALVLNICLEGPGGGAEAGGSLPAGLRASYLRDVRKLLRSVSTFRIPLILNAISINERDDHFNTIAKMVREAEAERYVNVLFSGGCHADFQTVLIT